MSVRTAETKDAFRPRSLRSNIFWTASGNSIFQVCQWGLLVVLARAGTTAMVGQFAFALALTAPFVLFANLGLRNLQATDARGEYRFAQYLTVRLLTTAAFLVALAALVLWGPLDQTNAAVILSVGVAKALESVSDLLYGLFQHHETMAPMSASLVSRGLLGLVFLGGAVLATGSVAWGCVGLAVAWALVLLLHDIPVARRVEAQARPRLWRGVRQTVWPALRGWRRLARLARLGLPLGLVVALASLGTNVPRYAIQRSGGEVALGIFASLTYVILPGTMLANSLGQAGSPRLATLWAGGESRRFLRLVAQLLALPVLVGLLGVLVSAIGGRQLLLVLYGSAYARETTAFIWVMAAGGATYAAGFLAYALTAARYVRIQLPLQVLTTLAILVAAIVLVPPFGLVGAAVSLFLGRLLQAAASMGLLVAGVARRS